MIGISYARTPLFPQIWRDFFLNFEKTSLSSVLANTIVAQLLFFVYRTTRVYVHDFYSKKSSPTVVTMANPIVTNNGPNPNLVTALATPPQSPIIRPITTTIPIHLTPPSNINSERAMRRSSSQLNKMRDKASMPLPSFWLRILWGSIILFCIAYPFKRVIKFEFPIKFPS